MQNCVVYLKAKGTPGLFNSGYRTLQFDFRAFAEWLVKSNDLVEIRYYIWALRRQNSEKSEKMYADQQKLIRKLQQQRIEIVLGQLIRHPDGSFHEKGVDVRLAVEMIRLGREDRYDVAYVISSDTDLVAAVEEVQSLGKTVCYVGAARRQSFGLTIAVKNNVILLRPEDIQPFLPALLV